MFKNNNNINKIIDEINLYIIKNVMKVQYKLNKSLINSFISINNSKNSKYKIKIIRNFYFEFKKKKASSSFFLNSLNNENDKYPFSLLEPLISTENKSKKKVFDLFKNNRNNKKLDDFDDIFFNKHSKKKLINFNIEISKYIYNIEDNNYYVENYFYCNNKLEKFNSKDFSNFIKFRNDYWKLSDKVKNMDNKLISLSNDYFNIEIDLLNNS